MATVPIDAPTVGMTVPGMTPAQGGEIRPIQDFAAKQMIDLGQGMMAAGKVANSIQNQIDDARTKGADNLLADEIRKIMYDPQNGYLTTSGKFALDSRKSTFDALTEAKKKVAGTLKDEFQQNMFNQVADRRLQSVFGQMDQHALQQVKIYNIGESKARMDSGIADAVATVNMPDVEGADGKMTSPHKQARATVTAEANDLANLSGMGPDQRQQLILQAQTKITENVIDSLISKDQSTNAVNYLAHAIEAKEVDPTRIDELQNKVKTNSLKTESTNLSFALTGKTERDQISELDAQFKDGKISAELRDATMQRVEHRFSIINQQKNEAYKTNMGSAQDWVIKHPGEPIINMPSNLYSAIKSQGGLNSIDAFARAEGKPANQKDELTNRGKLLNMAATDPQAFLKTFDENGFVNEIALGADGIKAMQNIAMQMKQGTGAYSNGFDNRIMQDAIPPSILKNKDKVDAFKAVQADAIIQWKKDNPGKIPTIDDQNKVAQSANAKWIDIGRLWNSTIQAHSVKSDMKAVPQDFYNGMKAAGAKTDDEIWDAWNLKKGKK